MALTVPAYPASDVARRSSVFLRKASQVVHEMKDSVLAEEYDLLKQLGTGRFGAVYLASHKKSGNQIALKIFPKETVRHVEFVREYNYSYFLSPHQSIIDTYEGTFQSELEYFFVQEFAPHGSLKDLIDKSTGNLAETLVKEIMEQVIAAIEYMHSEKLVHRNMKPENVLLFGSNPKAFTRVKIADFGLTRKEETLVKHLDSTNAYHAPELCDTLQKEAYTVDRTVDVWAIGIIIYYALRGRFPWSKATIMCKPYWEWEQWLKRKSPQLPRNWTRFSEKAMKLFKRSLNPKAKDRCSVKDLKKYVKERWLKELKCVSEDDLVEFTENDRMTRSMANVTVEEPAQTQPTTKRRSIVHQWFTSTLSAMSEISEQMVSAEDD